MQRRGQTFIMVMMLLLIASIFMAGIAFMWQGHFHIITLRQDSLRAFYIAEAGLERMRYEIALMDNAPDGYALNNQALGGGFYDVSVTLDAPGKVATLTSIGRYRDSQRQIVLNIGREPGKSCPPPPCGWAWGLVRKGMNSWREQ